MILSEMVDFVCTTISQTEATDRAACKMYFKLRHSMLWQLAMWKDSLASYTQTISSLNYDPTSSTWLPTRQILLVNPTLTHVVAVRTGDRSLSVQSEELFYCTDRNVFENQGSVVDYTLLHAAIWDFDTAQTLSSRCNDAADAGSLLEITDIASDGITEEESSISVAASVAEVETVMTILSLTKAASTGNIVIGIGGGFIVTYNGGGSMGVGLNGNLTVFLGPGESATFTPAATDTMLLSIADPDTINRTFNISDYGTSGTLTVVGSGSSGDRTFVENFSAVVTMTPTATIADERQRLKLIGGYADGTVLRVLGKRKCPRLEKDNDRPAIQGSEMCLIPAVHADMLKRERQYGKAITMAEKEFGPMLAVLMKEQTAQQAHKKRFVPTDGFGGADSFVGPNGGCFPF